MTTAAETCTADELVGRIRAALAEGDRPSAERDFAALLQQSSASAERWLRRVIVMTPAIRNASAFPVCDDLRQELAIALWEHIVDRRQSVWERRYWTALMFEQHHVATRYMRSAGLWASTTRGVALPMTEDAEAPDVLAIAEVTADVHAVLKRLPPKERAAVIFRYWMGMKERDIARELRCTDRTVRTLLTQARGRMGPWYEGSGRATTGIE
jgi:RNA polymerase sigma factor (sigma-70 family)